MTKTLSILLILIISGCSLFLSEEEIEKRKKIENRIFRDDYGYRSFPLTFITYKSEDNEKDSANIEFIVFGGTNKRDASAFMTIINKTKHKAYYEYTDNNGELNLKVQKGKFDISILGNGDIEYKDLIIDCDTIIVEFYLSSLVEY